VCGTVDRGRISISSAIIRASKPCSRQDLDIIRDHPRFKAMLAAAEARSAQS
jgi:hypothetical protein